MSRTALVIALALISLSGVAAGCGGGGGDSGGGGGQASGGESSNSATTATENTSSSTAPASAAAFVKEADAICVQTQQRIEKEVKAMLAKLHIKEFGQKGESPKEATEHSIEALEKVGIPQLRRQVEELRALEAPAEQATQFSAYLDALDELVEASEKEPQLLLGSGKKVFAKSDAQAKPIGFKVCGVH